MTGIQTCAGPGKLLGQTICKRQVHIIAPHQEMVSDSNTLQVKRSARLAYLNQTEIACSASNVAYEYPVAFPNRIAPPVPRVMDPGIEGNADASPA